MIKRLILCLAVLSLSQQYYYVCNDNPTYYVADGFHLHGGDVSSQLFNTYAEAIIDAKNFINGDKTKIATIIPAGGGKYTAYKKILASTKPSTVPNEKYDNVFYGKRIAQCKYLLT